MNISEVKKVVSQIKASLFKNSNSYSIGMLKSHFRGTGLQFKEHRVYASGDEVRFIDWKLLAKTSVPHIKTFEEERNVEIVVVLDASMSMLNGYKGVSKLQAGIELICLLYLLSQETKDYIHVVILKDKIINVPKKSGEEGIIQFISLLEQHDIINANGKLGVDIHYEEVISSENLYREVSKHLGKNKEIVLFSDFNDFLDTSDLDRLLYRRNVHAFQLLSPLDEAETIPYMLYTRTSQVHKKGNLKKTNMSKPIEEKFKLGKKVKKIRIQERYLETFVREMI
ncbi:MAG: DUF58 domain-containing protein [Bacteriovoracaceae bacterium]|jgi:uncharacterized protein (DUF58 family)|nr:DUF58 domain-containing protein [Bacteriovoracaceae bacterium]